MFCSSLRRRPLWRALAPLVTSSSPQKLQESEIEMHDLALPLPFTTPEVLAPILVLELENMSEGCLSQTKTRIQRFAATSKGQRTVIALVLKEDVDDQASLDGTQGFMALQAFLLESDISCPALPVPDPSSLLKILYKYLQGVRPLTKPALNPPGIIELIVQTTTTAPAKPLSEHEANIVSDIFSSFQTYEEATRTSQGQDKLYNFLDRSKAEDVIDFWAEEWIV